MQPRNRTWRIAARRLTITVAVAVLSGCGPASAPKPGEPQPLPDPPRVAACEPGQSGGRLALASPEAPRTFNPVFAFDNASDQVVRLLFSGLAQFDFARQEVAPGLAETWSVAPDGKTWTFKLRRGLRWSDGQPLTSADVVFTWNDVIYNPRVKAMLAPVFQVAGRGFAVSAPDAHTVVVVTPEVFAPFLEFFGTVAVLPRHVLRDAASRANFHSAYGVETPPAKLVGAGPFRLKACQPGQMTLLERNPAYWATDRAGRRLPYLDEVQIIVASEAGGVAGLFLAGNSDVCERVRGGEIAAIQPVVSQGRARLLELGPGAERDFLWFNQNTNVNRISGVPFVAPHKLAWFRDVRFRRAVSCGLDRDRLVREVYAGRAVPSETYLGPESGRWHNPDVPRFGFDRARARQLLAEAGLQDRNGDGIAEDTAGRACEITLLINTGNPTRERVAAFLAGDLRQIGIRAVLQAVPFPALEKQINTDFEYEAVLMGLSGGGGDPASHLNVLKSDESLHQWFPNQSQPATDWEARMDALMDALMRTLDFETRKRAFDEVQVILAEQAPMIYTATPLVHAVARTHLMNLRPALLAPSPVTWNTEELWWRAE